MLVAHTCNPSFSGGRDQEDRFKVSPGKYFTRPYLKKTHYKKGPVEWLKVGPEFKCQHCKKKKKLVKYT
jgi:hypothetical protein